jgi:hypothetical protein
MTYSVKLRKIELRCGVPLVGGKLVKSRGLAIVLRQSATTVRIESPEIATRGG